MLSRCSVLSVIIFTLVHLSSSLFERCDETYHLESNDNVTITSLATLNSRNVSSCRYSIIAPVNYIVKITCSLRFDQANSSFCPTKRFFVSVDGIHSLHRAQNFCNKNGTTRIIRRRSVMNRLVMAYVSKRDLDDENFTCVASIVKTKCDCGWSKRARIYNGINAQMHEFPSMIALIALSLNKVFCGGVIINEKWGLSGAHCFNEAEYSNLSNVIALVGEHDLSTQNETIYTVSHELEKYIRHENYQVDMFTQDYDIALIKTKLPIAFNLAVGPACLPFGHAHDTFDTQYAHAIGYGYLNYFDTVQATVLQKVALQILPVDKCRDSTLNKDKMCTYEHKKDSCVSDSGGPLILFIKGRQYVVGLISYGIACGTQHPSVNTRITSFMPWIEAKLENENICRK